jgi:uncharacterized phiE125 gp8 family phage protein
MALTLVTAPADEPVSLDDAKAHVREIEDAEDALIEGYLLAARQHVETYTRRALITQTWDYTVDGLGRQVELPKPPVQSVTSVQYLDSTGALQTLAVDQYRVVKRDTGETAIVPAYGAIWPSIYPVEAAVTVRFVCGYGTTPESVPQALRQAILLLTGHWFANREAVNVGNIVSELPLAVDALMFPHRVFY